MRYQINLCSAPCVKYVSEAEYMEQVLQVKVFMKGQYKEILDQLEIQNEPGIRKYAL
ncbi:MAG: hypothetical protein R3A45_13135 [Bdellovibrionota bacterium]